MFVLGVKKRGVMMSYKKRKYNHSLCDNLERREANKKRHDDKKKDEFKRRGVMKEETLETRSYCKQTLVKQLHYRESFNNKKLTEYKEFRDVKE